MNATLSTENFHPLEFRIVGTITMIILTVLGVLGEIFGVFISIG